MVLSCIMALCVRASTISRTVPRAPRDVLVLGVPTIRAPDPPRSAVVPGTGCVRPPLECQAGKALQTRTRSTKLRGGRTYAHASHHPCAPADERLGVCPPGRCFWELPGGDSAAPH